MGRDELGESEGRELVMISELLGEKESNLNDVGPRKRLAQHQPVWPRLTEQFDLVNCRGS